MDKGAELYRCFREKGDEEALAQIIREYRDGLIFYLNSIVGGLGTAEELAEDVFVLIGTRKPRDKGKGSFKTWLYTIARNLAIDHLRKTNRRAEVSVEDEEALAVEETPESAYLRQEQKAAVHRAMGQLKSEYRQVLWLIYVEEFSAGETAAVMKRSVHSVETLAYRARRALKTRLEQEGYCDENV